MSRTIIIYKCLLYHLVVNHKKIKLSFLCPQLYCLAIKFIIKAMTKRLSVADLGEGPRVEGGGGLGSLLWVKKEKSQSEEKPSGQAKQPPPPNPLAQGLTLPLAIRCFNKITFRKISIC